MTAYEQLSDLERERVNHEASEALQAAFNAAHEATGWCGDMNDKAWTAGLPIMREAFAKLMIRVRLRIR